MRSILLFLTLCSSSFISAQDTMMATARQLREAGLRDLASFRLLKELTTIAGHRLSGSPGYDTAVAWSVRELKNAGADTVWMEPVMVPKWVRGPVERAEVKVKGESIDLSICALGGSVGTGPRGVWGEVVEVRSFDELRALGATAKGKIIFFNRPFDKTLLNTGEAYGGAVNQRSNGAIEAAKAGAVAVLVRSMTNAIDDEPHTGAMRYQDSIRKIPAAAISTLDADLLSGYLQTHRSLTLTMHLSAESFPDVQSHSVIAEITGSTIPDEIVLIGGHLDAWDKGTGAHDDGSGVAQCIEVVRLFRILGIRPKRTIRIVLFANEENGLRGAREYARRVERMNERHLAAIESDAGGFLPRGFGVTADSLQFNAIRSAIPYLEQAGAEKITRGGGGADIGVLQRFGTALIGLHPESQRYFDYHHSNHDTLDKVHPRELELGAIAMAILALFLAQNGV